MKVKKLLTALLMLCVSAAFAAKPVGLWEGNSWKRMGELLKVTVFSPQ